jgi:hypothetical protein
LERENRYAVGTVGNVLCAEMLGVMLEVLEVVLEVLEVALEVL